MDISELELDNERLALNLDRALEAINDWIVSYAGDMCGAPHIVETLDRIDNSGGLLGHLSDILHKGSEALGKERMGNLRQPRKSYRMFYLVRHGQSQSNVDPFRNKNHPDQFALLTDTGKEQLAKTAAWLSRSNSLDLVYSSWLERARQSAEIIAEKAVKKVRLSPFIHEQDYGYWDGLSKEERRQLYPHEFEHFEMLKNRNAYWWARPPGGESASDVATRCKHWIDDVMRLTDPVDSTSILAVAHGMSIRVIVTLLMGEDQMFFNTLRNIPNGAVWGIGIDRGVPKNYGIMYDPNNEVENAQ